MSPPLTFVIPAFDAAATIGETIGSVLAQTVGPCPIIVVDDGSPDASAAIARQRAWPQVQIVRQRNAGLAAARNAALSEVRSEWVCFLDADDLVAAAFAERMLEAAAGAVRAAGAVGDVVACGYRYLSAAGEPSDWTVQPQRRDMSLERLLEHNAFAVGCLILSAPLLRELQRRDGHAFDPSLRVLEDWDLLIRLAQRGVSIATIVEEPLFEYRLRGGSLSSGLARMHETGLSVLSRAARDDAERSRVIRRWRLRSLGRALASGEIALARRLAGEGQPEMEELALVAGALRTELRRLAVARGAPDADRCRESGPTRRPTAAQEWSLGAADVLGAAAAGALAPLVGVASALAAIARELAAIALRRRVVLAGMGRNGRELAAALAAAGCSRAHWVDDAPDAGGPAAWRRLRWSDLHPRDLVIVTPDESAALVRRAQATGADAVTLAELLAGRPLPAAPSPLTASAASASP